jgi:hypothetical protein
MKEMITNDEQAWTSGPYRGTNHCWMMHCSLCPQPYLHHCKKPSLFLRISLGMSKGQDHHSSIVTDLFHNSLSLSGSAFSAVVLSTSTMSSLTYTLSPMMTKSQLSSENMSSYYMAHPHQQRPSSPMGIGSSHGRLWLKPLCSSSSIASRNFPCTANTSNTSSLPYQSSSTLESSIMTGLSAFKSHSDMISSCQTLQNSQIYRSSGSTIPSTSLRPNLQSLSLDNSLTINAAHHVEDGMSAGALTQHPPAITYMSAPSARTLATLSVTAPAPTRSKKASLGFRWENRPKYAWHYIWDSDEFSYISTALSSEFVPPVPCPPHNELDNRVTLTTINSYPHLFHVTTPVKIEHFHQLLTSHPNQALVESVCQGLEDGFWPWAITKHSTAPSIVDNALLQKIKNPQHLQLIREQHNEEIALWQFSEPFNSLLSGMTTIPLWVVPKPHSDKLRLVVNQSAGDFSPNSFIMSEDASMHLDSLHALGAALIRVREQYRNIPLVLFKTDVSQAYRHLPMHPLWQLHQVVTIDSKHHIDNNNDFGNRGAGRLWVVFFSLVLWIAVFIKFISDLFSYVDDSFSWEFTDHMEFYVPYQKLMPTKQVHLLLHFNELGMNASKSPVHP